MTTNNHPGRNGPDRRPRGGTLAAIVFLGAFAAAGCDGIFDAEDPGAILEEELTDQTMLDPLVAGMVHRYNASVDDGPIRIGGLISDELTASGTWPGWHLASRDGIINRDQQGDITDQSWPTMSRARYHAQMVVDAVAEASPDPSADPRGALGHTYLSMSYSNLAGMFCQQAYDLGPPVESSESYRLAEQAATEGLQVAQAAGVDSIANLAYLARARARLMQGDYAGAASDARNVPTGFTWWGRFDLGSNVTLTTWGATRSRNESTVGEAFHDTGDPRTVVTFREGITGADGETPVWHQEKYPDQDSDIRVASWQEARLIEAEALIEGEGNPSGAVALMNEVRSAWPELDPYDANISVEEARERLRWERAQELFLEGHRFADMRRWDLFPAGWGLTCVIFPRAEENVNPNIPSTG